MTTHQVIADGIRLHVVEAGEGPALLMLHGLAATHANWEHTIAAFAERWRVIAPDLPGHGGSEKPDAPYTLDFYAGIVRSLGRALAVEDAVVMGNSFGGLVAMELARGYPTWTRALVLAAPAVGFPSVPAAVAQLVPALAGPRLMRVLLPWALELCFHDRASAACAARRRLLADRFMHEDLPGFARATAASAAAVISAGALAPIPQPTLAVWGREDRLVPVSRSRALHPFVPHARIEVLADCGHLPMLERPAEFNEVVERFLGDGVSVPTHAGARVVGQARGHPAPVGERGRRRRPHGGSGPSAPGERGGP